LTLAIFCTACLTFSTPASLSTTRPPTSEVHGLWVVRTSLTSREEIATVVKTAERGGFNALFVQVRGRGDAFYRSAVEPRSAELEGQPSGFDPLAVTLDLAHRAGLRVHAWIAVNLVSSAVSLPRSPSHVVNRHPEWLMVPAALARSTRDLTPTSRAYVQRLAQWTRQVSDQVEGLFLSPVSPAARDYTVSVVKDLVANYAVDGVHFDYVRYPAETFDYSAATLAAFRETQISSTSSPERSRLDDRTRMAPTAWADAFPESWAAFRRERLTTLVRALTAAVRETRPGTAVSAAVVPRADEARTRRLQDWPRWAAAGELDAVCPMAYVTDDEDFRALVLHAREAAGRVPVWAGIGAFRLRAGEAATQVRTARRAGAGGMVLFSFDSISSGSRYVDALRAAFEDRQP
jgi:uncharacterized lipoprotein YddW (UPF0748 family)